MTEACSRDLDGLYDKIDIDQSWNELVDKYQFYCGLLNNLSPEINRNTESMISSAITGWYKVQEIFLEKALSARNSDLVIKTFIPSLETIARDFQAFIQVNFFPQFCVISPQEILKGLQAKQLQEPAKDCFVAILDSTHEVVSNSIQ